MSSEHIYDMAVLEQEVNLRVNRYITHNLIYKIQEGAAKYGREEFDEGEIREQAYVCYMTGAAFMCRPGLLTWNSSAVWTGAAPGQEKGRLWKRMPVS